uniref:Nuclear transcription factor Y subunit gamma n=1 Tax=Strigamia maritima TaxID=126957 RepID=T1JD69_STRMM
MKLDEDVKMISAEAPVLFAKAAEIFITELSLRAWVHTEDNKRRTLQRNDIAMAITKFDQFDFLIDIVPRDELKPAKRPEEAVRTTAMLPDQVQYYFQLAQQHQAALQQQTSTGQATVDNNSIQIVQQPSGQLQTVTTQAIPVQMTSAQQTLGTQAQATNDVANAQVQATQLQVQVPVTQAQQTQQVIQIPQAQMQQQGGIQIIQQVITPTGEVQQIPIQLTPSQVQLIRQMQGQNTNQPIIIQAAPLQTTAAAAAAAPQQTAQVFQIQQVPAQAQNPTPVFLTQAAVAGQPTIQIQQAGQEVATVTEEQ